MEGAEQLTTHEKEDAEKETNQEQREDRPAHPTAASNCER
jgi:hypothetical protein